MKRSFLRLQAALMAGLMFFATDAAHAAGGPKPWQMWYQPAATPVAERAFGLHYALIYVITFIVLFVFGLLLIVMVRFNAKANPVPKQFVHNPMLEVLWTVIPVVILVCIAIPSWQLIFYQDRTAKPEMTLKVTGYQWYWGYEYPDYKNDKGDAFNFLSNHIADKDIDAAKGQVRMLSTDNPVVVPTDTNIQLLITSSDVIHSWSVPSFSVKLDAVPGRINETWMRITKPGTYYGQCDQLCGQNHSFMPIEIRAVPKDVFQAWVKDPAHKVPAEIASADTPAPAAADEAKKDEPAAAEPAKEDEPKEEGQE